LRVFSSSTIAFTLMLPLLVTEAMVLMVIPAPVVLTE
jgi:hypothetical protein